MCPPGSLDLMKNSQRSEDLQAVSEQWHLLMVGLCPAPNSQGKGKACVTSLPNVGWLSLSLWQGGLRLVDQDGVHTSHEVLEPEIPTPPPAINQRGVPPTLRMCRCVWVGAPKPEAPPGVPTCRQGGRPWPACKSRLASEVAPWVDARSFPAEACGAGRRERVRRGN